jgi:hypothetical protein
VAPAENGLVARTQFSAHLVEPASHWTQGAVTRPPSGLVLTARGLRLWAIASGQADPSGYLLGTADAENPIHRAAGAQLAMLTLTAVAIITRPGPGWRITSQKRQRRLVELIGEPPAGAEADWPS